jgi:transcriptional regulator with XRE-family HTH domain
VGQRVRAEREHRGWTQAEFAERLKGEGIFLHPSAIAKIEDRNAEQPRIVKLREAMAFAKVFDITVDALIAAKAPPTEAEARIVRARAAVEDASRKVHVAQAKIDTITRELADIDRRAPLIPNPFPSAEGRQTERLERMLDGAYDMLAEATADQQDAHVRLRRLLEDSRSAGES